MKPFLFALVFLWSLVGQAQDTIPLPSSDLYTYDDATQTYDYSGQWDFDNDLETDQLILVGNGGAHVYFHFKLTLSGNGRTYEYPMLSIDWPEVGGLERLENQSFYPPPLLSGFWVEDLDKDAEPEIYIQLDQKTYHAVQFSLNAMGIHARFILLDVKNGEPELRNFLE